jgi:hypothetical protein
MDCSRDRAIGRTLLAAIAASGLSAFATLASAQTPVAVVEEVKGGSGRVEFMDYVEAGKVIRLAPQASIVLSYMKSCVRETINGGTVTVGINQSEVQSGQVERTTVGCDASRMLLAPQEANQAAGLVFRELPAAKPQFTLSKPQFTLYGLSPIVEVNGGDALMVERLDKKGERFVLTISKTQLVRGAFFDFADSDDSLTAGGVYRIVLGKQQLVFKVHPNAKPGRTPIVGRLMRFEPAS